jgi:Cys-tRNA(Pro) deacylase
MPLQTPDDVQAALDALSLGIQVQIQPTSTATAQQAAQSLGTPLGSIVKSLCFLVDGAPMVVLVAGDRKVDGIKLGHHLGVHRKKVRIADAETTITATGYAPGGVPPLGHRNRLPILIDDSLSRFEIVYAAAGATNAVFAISPSALAHATEGIVLDLAEELITS